MPILVKLLLYILLGVAILLDPLRMVAGLAIGAAGWLFFAALGRLIR